MFRAPIVYVWVCTIFFCVTNATEVEVDIPCGKCASHEEPVGEYCVLYADPIHECPTGFTLENGVCTRETKYCTSENGTIVECDDTLIQPTSEPTYLCPSNTVLYNEECVVSVPAVQTVEKTTCPAFTTWDRRTEKCVRIEQPENVCSEGFNNTASELCERISYTSKVLTCPDGYIRSAHDTCMRLPTEKTVGKTLGLIKVQTSKCPANTAQIDATCVQVKSATAKCQDGFTYTNHQCVRMDSLHGHRRLYSTHSQDGDTNILTERHHIYPTHMHQANHPNTHHVNHPHTHHKYNTHSEHHTPRKYEIAPRNYVAMPVCPTGTIGTSDGECLGTAEPYRRCPDGYIPRGSECTQTLHKHAVAICPKPYLLNDGICMRNRRTSTVALCSEGVRDGNFCITKQSHRVQYQCPDGYALSYDHISTTLEHTLDVRAPLCSKIMRYDCSGESITLECEDVPSCENANDGKSCMQEQHHLHTKAEIIPHKQKHMHLYKKIPHHSHIQARSLHEKPGQICKQVSHKHHRTCTKELTAESTPFCFPGAVLARNTCEKIEWSTPTAHCPTDCLPNDYTSPIYMCTEGSASSVSATMCIITKTESVSLHCSAGYRLDRGLGLCVEMPIQSKNLPLNASGTNGRINSHPVMFQCDDGYVKANVWADVRKRCVGSITDAIETNDKTNARNTNITHPWTTVQSSNSGTDIVEMVLGCGINSKLLNDGRCQRIEYTKSQKVCKDNMQLRMNMCVQYSNPDTQKRSFCNEGLVLSSDGKTCHRTIVPKSQMRRQRFASDAGSQSEPNIHDAPWSKNGTCVLHPRNPTLGVCKNVQTTKAVTHCTEGMHMMGLHCVQLRHQSLNCVVSPI